MDQSLLLVLDGRLGDRTTLAHQLVREFPRLRVKTVFDEVGFAKALRQGRFDFVVVQKSLCRGGFRDVLQAVKEKWPECPVVLWAAANGTSGSHLPARRGADEGASDVLEHSAALGAAVRAVLKSARRKVDGHDAEARYRTLFDGVPVGLYRVRPDGRILDANLALVEMLGFPSREALLAANAKDLYADPEDRREWQRMMDNKRVVRDFEIRLRRLDGKIIWAQDNARAVRDDQGRIVCFEGSLEDITERRQAEEALRRSEARYRLLMESINDIVYLKTVEDESLRGSIQVMSDRVEAITGYRAEEFREDAGLWKRVMHPDDLPAVIESTEELVAEKKPVTRVYRIRHKVTGEYCWLEDKAVPQINEHGEVIGILGLARDITERKLAEAEQERLQAQLLQAQKMEAIGTLVGGIAHDFNNLLTGISGYIELTMTEFDERDPLYHNLKKAQRASVRAANLTRQLLLFSRRQPMQKDLLNLNEVVEGMADMARRLIGEGITVSTDLAEGVWTTEADAGQIEQVLMNLIVNARDAMPAGGHLLIQTQNVEVDSQYCETVPYARPGRFVCVSVSDTGVGMDKETARRVFEPFFTTKGAGHGTGLGMSVAYGIVKQHGGWINVYSEPGKGSTFRFYLPAVRAEPRAAQHAEMRRFDGLKSRTGERVLVVEDEDVVRELSIRTLEEHGYHTCAAASVEEALEVFEREQGNFSMVITDVVLPDQSGLDLIHELHKQKPGLAVLLTSGYSDPKSQWEQIRQRGFRFLQKPFSLVELLGAVREVLDNRRAQGRCCRKA